MNDLGKMTVAELKGIFPLQTIQSMAERWGVQRQVVNNWYLRHHDFPQPVKGAVVESKRTGLMFSNAEMLRYEKARELPK